MVLNVIHVLTGITKELRALCDLRLRIDAGDERARTAVQQHYFTHITANLRHNVQGPSEPMLMYDHRSQSLATKHKAHLKNNAASQLSSDTHEAHI